MKKSISLLMSLVMLTGLLFAFTFFRTNPVQVSAAEQLWYGDVNKNGEISTDDALLVLRHVVGLKQITDKEAYILADMDHDGECSVTDAITILKTAVRIVGKVPYTQKTLVVYFSCTGTTERIANDAEDILGADSYQIIAADPYTEEDLAYYTNGRADREQRDPSARPAIAGGVKNMEQYDRILLGYPIWHGQAPRIISTFLESYDFSGKTILPFCTSHSSGIGSSDMDLYRLAPGAKWLKGRRFGSGTAKKEVEEWLREMEFAERIKISI